VARERLGPQIPIEVEIDKLEDLQPAIDAGADIVLLDNMAPDQVRAAVAQAAGRIALEASGGIGIDTLRAYAETGVDRISMGALTHAARSMNLSMTVAPAPPDP
jgi:nicotinate-nucleotide pyrophosphorylase (carboxylating)